MEIIFDFTSYDMKIEIRVGCLVSSIQEAVLDWVKKETLAPVLVANART